MPAKPEPLIRLLGTPTFAHALTISILGAAVLAPAIRAFIGWPGMLALLTGLVALAIVSLTQREEPVNWPTALPFSLLTFLGLAVLSLFWSQYQWATAGGLAYLATFTVLGVYIALARDAIQVVRAFGDVLRVVLAASLVLEVFSGVLIDMPIPFLGIEGRLSQLGPIQGLLHSSNQLGMVTVIALVTFIVEARTRSVRTGLAIASMVLGTITLLLTRAPVVYGTALVALIGIAALYAVRRAPVAMRNTLQYVILGIGAISTVVLWVFRGPIIVAFDAADVLAYRLGVWQQAMALLDLYPVQGWGWIGTWRPEITPFSTVLATGGVPTSARSAWVDVWFQLGLIGFAVFVGFIGLAFVRAWLLAGRKRSVIYTWPAIVLGSLIVFSFAESSILIEFGWLTAVVCAVKVGQELSWRKAFE